MLLTTCPNCQAQFKVSTEQLNVRSGRVMCGRCRHVFNSFESLQRIGSGPDPVRPIEEPAAPAVDVAAPILDDRVAAESPATPDSSPSAPINIPAFLDVAQPPRPPETNTLSPYRNAPLALPDTEPQSKAAGWAIAAVMAGIALLAQGTYLWRSEIVSHYPQLRPHLAQACDVIGCTLPWGRDQRALKVEHSDLIEELGSRGRFLLTATIANRAPTTQDLPHLELSLTDTNNQTLARRILAPADYLGRPLARGEGMNPGSSALVNVRIESKAVNAAGYHVELFFP
jgi:predicted Zn finger-like uncharacterized protein